MRNIRFAIRTLAKTPIVSAVAILSLALGIGANTAIFSLFEQLLIRKLPVDRPEQLVNLTATGPRSGSMSNNNAGGNDAIFSYPMFRDLEKNQTVLAGIAAHRGFFANLSYKGNPATGSGMQVSGSYFGLLGLQPAIGRLIGPADDRVPGAHPVVVLSYEYWVSRFEADPRVLNEPLMVNGSMLTIIGVAPQGFRGTSAGIVPDFFVPISMQEALTPGWKGFEERKSYWVYLFGRLKPGMTIEQAQAGMHALYSGIIRETDLPLQTGASDRYRKEFAEQAMILKPGARGQSSFFGAVRAPITILFSITGFVLLIACANIANLLLAQSAGRAKEFSVRQSLGASRAQIMGQVLTEAIVLSLLAGVAALFVAYATGQMIQSLIPPEDQRVLSSTLAPATLIFALSISIVAGLLFGLFPAAHASRQDLAGAMKDQATSVSGSGAAARLRRGLVTVQIAVCVLLLVSAGLFLKSLANILRVDLGIETRNMIVFSVAPRLNQYTPERSRALFEELERKLGAIPGAAAVTVSMVPLIAGNNWGQNVSVDGFEAGPDTDTHSMYNHVGSGFFRTLGISLMAGREFAASDAPNAPRVAVVNEAFARKFSPNSSIVGKRMQLGRGGKNDIEIVGVARDSGYSNVKQAIPPVFYRPYRQDPEFGAGSFYVATALSPETLVPQVRKAVAELDPNLPLADLKTLEAQVQENIAGDRVVSTLSAAFAALATLLAAVGLYGVLAYTVARRTREIGIRIAVGADAGSIRGLVFREVAWMIGIGIALGVPAALALARLAESELYEMKANDPLVVMAAVAVVVGVSLLAAYIPAQRAVSVDPISALRYE
jgi:predicted permease